MAGHSHSANIAVRKGKQDKARAKLFSKLSRYIMIAAKNGDGDPATNLRLRYAIDKARAVSMPKENIERAVKKGTGELEGENYEETTYEGYGPGGIAILVTALTDNRARTSGDVRIIFDKNGGNMGTPGTVAYLFDHKGLILIDAVKYPAEDAVMTAAMDAEADDFANEAGHYVVSCDPAKLSRVQDALVSAKYELVESELKYIPKVPAVVNLELGQRIARLIDLFDANDDVQNVYTSAQLTAEMLE